MYKAGDISYLEVLLGSKGFGDFIQRLKALKLIVDSDVRILKEQKEDRDLVAAKKEEIDRHLDKLEGLFAQAEALKAELEGKRKQKTVVIASLEAKEGQLKELRAEEERALRNLMARLEKKYDLRQKLYYTGGKFTWPVPGHYDISSGYGARKDPFTGILTGHLGIDIPAPRGTNIVAAAAGIVAYAGYVRGYGYTVIIDHGGGIRTLYGHGLKNGFQVKAGQEVKAGQHIHEVGSTGRSTGYHCHFSVYKDGVRIDPMPFLK